MILPLRQRHRHIMLALGVFLPMAFAAGIVARKPVPTSAVLPASLTIAPQHCESVEWVRNDLFAKAPIQVRLTREQKGAGRFAVDFAVSEDFVKPDLIVYWVAGNPNVTDTLPDQAFLLGVFNPIAPLVLPTEVESGEGVLVLYSLADQEVIEVSKPFAARKP